MPGMPDPKTGLTSAEPRSPARCEGHSFVQSGLKGHSLGGTIKSFNASQLTHSAHSCCSIEAATENTTKLEEQANVESRIADTLAWDYKQICVIRETDAETIQSFS